MSMPLWHAIVMDMNEEVREAAREALKKEGWTQAQWAKEAGVKQSTASRFLSGKRNDAEDSVVKLLAALGLELTVKEKSR